jgi:hypothetical protein
VLRSRLSASSCPRRAAVTRGWHMTCTARRRLAGPLGSASTGGRWGHDSPTTRRFAWCVPCPCAAFSRAAVPRDRPGPTVRRAALRAATTSKGGTAAAQRCSLSAAVDPSAPRRRGPPEVKKGPQR